MLSDGAGPCLSTPSLMWKCAERGAASRRSLLLTINSRRGSEGLEGDLVAKAFELADKAIFVGVVAVAPQEVVGTEVVVRLLARKDVVGAHEDGVDDGADGLLVAAPALEPRVLRAEVGALAAEPTRGRASPSQRPCRRRAPRSRACGSDRPDRRYRCSPSPSPDAR